MEMNGNEWISCEALADREWRSAQDRIEVLETRRNEAPGTDDMEFII